MLFPRAFSKLKHSANNIFFLNLGFIYTLCALVVHPFSIYLLAVRRLVDPNEAVSAIACQVTGTVFEISIYASLFSLTSVSLDRLVLTHSTVDDQVP